MTQRIFDMENEQDVKDLFDILPDCVCRVEEAREYGYLVLHYNRSVVRAQTSVLAIKWGKRHFADRPVDKSKWIGKLCWLWVKDEKLKVLGELSRIDTGYFYRDFDPMPYANCEPVKRSEIKLVEDRE